MRKIFESSPVGRNESCYKITVYTVDDDEEWFKLDMMSDGEMCEMLGVCDDSKYEYAIPPGGGYYTYSFDLLSEFFIVVERYALNV